jgi:drug/metabolite transporter (DMT)-like permease
LSSQRINKLIMVMTLCLFWGLAFVAIRVALIYVSPITLTFLRFSVASILFGSYFVARRLSISLNMIPKVALLGFIGFTAYHLSLNVGETESAAGAASLVIAAGPIFIALLSSTVLHEKITIFKAAGSILAFTGLAAILIPSVLTSENPLKVLAILPAPICTAIYTIYGKLYLKKYDPTVLTGYAHIFGLFPLIPLLRYSSIREVVTLPFGGWISILFLGVCSSTLAYTLWYKLLRDSEATIVGSYIYLVSLIAVVGGYIILSEPITMLLIAGGILVVAGVYLANHK